MSPTSARAALRRQVEALAAAHTVEPRFTDQTPLFDGLLESIDVLELVLFIEETSGRPLDVERLTPRCLRTIDAIYDTFFADAAR